MDTIEGNRSAERITILAMVLSILTVIVQVHEHNMNAMVLPCRTSILSGYAWVLELIDRPNEKAFQESFRMKRITFRRLYTDLQNIAGLGATRYVSLCEQLAMFLFITGHNASSRLAQERFQRSGETIHRHFRNVLDGILQLYPTAISLPTATTSLSPDISENPKYYPYFKDCIGALDGCHVPIHVSTENQSAYRNRKGFISTNVLGVVDMDGRFVYIFPGWEGAAGDSRVLDSARQGDFLVPKGKYYLADAGYGLSTEILTPYRGVRYHLKEWSQVANARPADYKELFNLRHASLRNVIERRFGTWKRQFRILLNGSEYPCDIQIKIITALAIVSNYILDDGEIIYENESVLEEDRDEMEQELEAIYRDRDQGKLFRDRLAKAMWRDYKVYLNKL